MELLEGRWAIQILAAMKNGPVRLSQLKRSNPVASKKALTARLRWLESAGVVVRRDLSTSVLRVEYELADAMRQPLLELLDHLAQLGALYEEAGQSHGDEAGSIAFRSTPSVK